MRKLLALLAVIVLIAGCVGQSATQTSSTEPEKTPTETASLPPSAGVTVTSVPTTVVENSRFPVTWKVFTAQAMPITSTVLYYDKLSHAGDAPTAMQPSMLKYASVTPAQKGTTPATFTDYVAPGSAAGDSPGKAYFRAYALISGLNYWSDEYVVTVVPKASITVSDFPSSVGKSSTFNVKWDIKNGYPGKVDKTYVMWGTLSGMYTGTSPEQAGNTPASFQATLTSPSTAPGTFYFIVTAVVDGKAINSTEKSLTVY
jgi:hypothetical protein